MFSALFRSIVVFTMKRLLLGYSFHNSLIVSGKMQSTRALSKALTQTTSSHCYYWI